MVSSRLCVKESIRKWQNHFAVANRVECWTVLERTTWRLLEANGTLTCPIAKADSDPMFQEAYAWMAASMIEAGISAPERNLSPWWCWINRDPGNPEPYAEDLEGLDDPVVLQLSIPAFEVALSCFDLWHFVLNRSYVYSSEQDELEFDGAQATAANKPLLEARIRASWAAVFDLAQTSVDMGPLESKSIQGCFWVLRRDNVTAILERAALNSYE